jgi:sugar phosphate isomerase/epimerase
MYHNSAVIEECFRKLSPWIVSCHAKDLQWKKYSQVCLLEVIPGHGVMDYRAYLKGVSSLPVDAPLMLEHLKTPAEYDEGRRYIQKVGHEMGLSFESEGA